MGCETRTVLFDRDLQFEAYRFKGIQQKFPNHFHEYYVIGFIENGKRRMTCKNRDYIITGGDMILLNPLDNHACEQIDGLAMDWRCLNIREEVMRLTVREITGQNYLPRFPEPAVLQAAQVPLLRELHTFVLEERAFLEKEELYYLFMEQLIAAYALKMGENTVSERAEIQAACRYIEEHYTGPITLDDLSRVSGLNKYTLLRSFTKQRGVTPYQYLETIRVNAAKTLLEQGTAPVDAAAQTGFTDQSHFTRFFKNFTGITPGQYLKLFQGNAPSATPGDRRPA